MKFVAFTFDDGRSDNYLLAKRIMDKYQFCGTVYITTGFIDGTWENKDVLQSPTRPLTVEEINELYASGWEIGAHGDKHKTQVDDMRTALNKLQSWGVSNRSWGISVPNSNASESEVKAIFESEYGKKIAYVRRGRKCDTSLLINKILYVLYSFLKIKWAYCRFNSKNALTLDMIDKSNIQSVVVKSTDNPNMIIDFITKLPENTGVVLMFHSILASDHPKCGNDPWSWDVKKLENLCAQLDELTLRENLRVTTLVDLIES